MKRRLLLASFAFLFLAGCGPEPAAAPTATATVPLAPGSLLVDPGRDLGPISPYVYGTNYGPMNAVVTERMPLVKSAGFTTLRFPAGAWTDMVDVQPFQIDMLMDFCREVGAMPTISVRLLGGTPEAAAALVRYTNLEKKYGVVYWSIGNEPSIYTAMGYADADYTVADLNRDWRPIAEAMKAVDPTIRLIGPEIHQWDDRLEDTPKDSAEQDWMTEFLKANGDLVDVVSIHRYPLYSPANGPVTVAQLRANTREWDAEIGYLRSRMRETLGRELPVAVTEVNSDPSSAMLQTASPDSFYNAIWYADVLGHLIDLDVFMVDQWSLSQRSGGLGLLSGSEVRPTFYVFPLYRNFGDRRVYAESAAADVDVFAATRSDGALTVMVINLGDGETRVPLAVAGRRPAAAEVWLLDAEHNAENLGTRSLPADGTLTLPAQSATLYVMQ